jgi:hypothetical protein
VRAGWTATTQSPTRRGGSNTGVRAKPKGPGARCLFELAGPKYCYTTVVRGDSLRDLYAKTLALLGLGVLAGAGALVDYWPVGLRLVPAAPPLLQLAGPADSVVVPLRPSDALPAAMSHVAAVVPKPNNRPVPQVVSFEPPLLAVAETPAPFAELVASESIESLPAASVAAIALSQPAGDSLQDALPETLDAVLVAESDFPADALVAVSEWREPVTLADASASEGEDGFIAGALRKTRSSLVRTGALTGASIVDAVRVVGGAVRRALPN